MGTLSTHLLMGNFLKTVTVGTSFCYPLMGTYKNNPIIVNDVVAIDPVCEHFIQKNEMIKYIA